MSDLEIKNLHVEIEGKEILKGVNLEASKGEVAALMGPNGAGKSSLGYALMGHPNYKVTAGKITFKGEDITKLPPNERAKKGLFLSFQYPSEVPGVSMANFLRTAINSRRDKKPTSTGVDGAQSQQRNSANGGMRNRAQPDLRLGNPMPVGEFIKQLREKMKMLKIDESFMHRYLNEGFSGGEKKRAEILQMAMLKPEMAVLDETDSGLDVDSLKVVAEGINRLLNPETGVLLITHYQRILDYVKPNRVYIMMAGKIAKSGGAELVQQIENKGYESIKVKAQ
ncbi:ABC transporter ATP-binding protein [Candidatus Woesearchaeota archaeon]|nr:ABC transporter ATP-binding protein [Candidatus Woesearchaeota archaeon]